MIRIVKEADAARIAEIYNHYILNTRVTFEEHPVTPEEILARLKSITTADTAGRIRNAGASKFLLRKRRI